MCQRDISIVRRSYRLLLLTAPEFLTELRLSTALRTQNAITAQHECRGCQVSVNHDHGESDSTYRRSTVLRFSVP